MAARALITGGSGYFGCLLRDQLLARGDSVRVFDLRDADDRPPEVEFVKGDIREPASIAAACDGIEMVFHNVAQVPLAKDRELFWSVNYEGTENLLRAVRDTGVRKLVHTSSSAIFGIPQRNPVDESVAPVPGEAYGHAKLEGERLVQRYVKTEGIDASIIRPRTILGHGRLGIFQILFDWIEGGYNVPVLGRGDNLYQFVHGDDLAAASILAAEQPGPSVYNIGASEFGSMRETLEALCKHAGTGSRVRSIPMAPAVAAMKLTSAIGLSPLGPYHAMMYGRSMYFDTSRAQNELGWQAEWSNAAMICDSYDWYRANKEQAMKHGASPHKSAVRQGILALAKHII
ncbi:MAG: nucleoside-diphosphate-sugar epimerase [Myxococcota bacterium]|jgi:nucleoside-diphosphate-sugar epimerase